MSCIGDTEGILRESLVILLGSYPKRVTPLNNKNYSRPMIDWL